MGIWDYRRSAFGICAAAPMLAGCGGSQPLIGAEGAIPKSIGTQWPKAALSLELCNALPGQSC